MEAARDRTARASPLLLSIRLRPGTKQETTKPSFRMRDILPSSNQNYPDKRGARQSGSLGRSQTMQALRPSMPLFSQLEIARTFRSCFQNLMVGRHTLASLYEIPLCFSKI